MDYLRTTQPSNMGTTSQVANDVSVPRQAATDAIRSRAAALQAPKFNPGQLDRVTVSPAARGLADAVGTVSPASQERLDFLRQSIRENTLPIYPQRVAEAILAEERQEDSDAVSVVGNAAPLSR